MEVGLGSGHSVLDGDPASPKGAQPPIFGPCLLWPNGWMDQDAIWKGGRPWPRRHYVRWGPSCPKKGAHQPPSFRLMYCGQTVGWIKMKLAMEVGLDSDHIVLDGDPAPPPQKGHSPNFRTTSIVAKRSPMSAEQLWANMT